MAHHKGRGIQFGGVHDIEESEEGMESEFFNGLGVWNVERNRYFPMNLRRARQAKKLANSADDGRGRGGGGGGARGGRGKKDEEELLANLRALELKAAGTKAEDVVSVEELKPSEVDEDDTDKKIDQPVLWEMPHPRFNAQLAVQDDVLYIFGGTFEKADREFTFSDLYAIDLGKLDGVKQLFKRELDDWVGEESSSDEEDEDEEDDDSDDEDGEEEDEAETRSKLASRAVDISAEAPSSPASSTAFVEEETAPEVETAEPDNTPHPRPFESLRDFFQRTGNAWQEIVIEEESRKPKSMFGEERQAIKEIRKNAFDKAEEKWWDCREEIQALEDEQDEAGIGEIVSLADKSGQGGSGSGAGGAGRRR